MRCKLWIAAATIAACVGVTWSWTNGAERSIAPLMATIVIEAPVAKDGVGAIRAIRVTDTDKLSALEAFFPNYRRRPSTDTAAAWEAGHRIYFDFPGGETIRVTVSRNQNARFWSVGRGDLMTRGDFHAFVNAMKTR